MNLNKYLDVKPEVAQAIAQGKPVVALESTIISHGMPYPQNVETALNVEKIIRENGAVPATESGCLPLAASAVCTGGRRPPWTSPPIWRSWPTPL